MKGRTLNALIRQSDEWHLRIREERASKNVPLKNIIWENSFIKPFERVEGNIETTNHKIYTIKELLNSNELSKEGKEMGHCVGSYAQKCVKRNTAIFAFGTRNYWELKTERLVTIEINLQTMEIVQAKGKYNRNTTEKERQIIGYWLDENNLEKSRWINW